VSHPDDGTDRCGAARKELTLPTTIASNSSNIQQAGVGPFEAGIEDGAGLAIRNSVVEFD
jgi:hypothetical protein